MHEKNVGLRRRCGKCTYPIHDRSHVFDRTLSKHSGRTSGAIRGRNRRTVAFLRTSWKMVNWSVELLVNLWPRNRYLTAEAESKSFALLQPSRALSIASPRHTFLNRLRTAKNGWAPGNRLPMRRTRNFLHIACHPPLLAQRASMAISGPRLSGKPFTPTAVWLCNNDA